MTISNKCNLFAHNVVYGVTVEHADSDLQA